MTALLWLLVALPAGVGAALCLAGLLTPGRRTDAVAAAVAPATAAGIVVIAVLVATGRPAVQERFVAGADFALAVDGLSALMVLTAAIAALAALLYAAPAPDGPSNAGQARFAGLMLLFVAAVLLTATATTLPALLIGWEAMGACSYALIGFRWREPERVASGAVAFLTTRFADLGLYAAAAAGLAGGAGLALADLPAAAGAWQHVAAAGVLTAALGKAAQLPFSFWLSRAMQGPSAVSALLHSAAMVAMGGYLLLRTEPLLAATGWAGPTAAWAGAVTAVVLGVVALAQRDLKQLLAASTAAQLGFVILGAGVGAIAGGATHLVAHAATKALLFLAAGAWLTALGTKALPGLTGVARRWRVLGICAVVGGLALAGLAPLSLWATKDEVLAGARASSPALYAVGVLGTALAAAYAAKIVAVIVARPDAAAEAEWDNEQEGTRRVGAARQAPLPALALGAAGLGVLALPPLADTVRAEFGLAQEHQAVPWEWALSALLTLAVFGSVCLRTHDGTSASPAGAARSWFGLGTAAQAVAVRPTMTAAAVLARFDDRVLDHGTEALAAATVRSARFLCVFDDRGVDGLVTCAGRAGVATGHRSAVFDDRGLDRMTQEFADGVRALSAHARRAQTGLVHQYYLQLLMLVAAIGVLVWLVN